MSERCENCGRAIGALETAQLWNERVVCVDCRRKLDAEWLPARATPPPPHRATQRPPMMPVQINVQPTPVYVPVGVPIERGDNFFLLALGIVMVVASVCVLPFSLLWAGIVFVISFIILIVGAVTGW